MTLELLAVSQLVPLVESFIPVSEGVVAECEGRPVDLVVLHAGKLAVRSPVENRCACRKRDVPSFVVLQLPPSVHPVLAEQLGVLRVLPTHLVRNSKSVRHRIVPLTERAMEHQKSPRRSVQ